MVMVRVRARVRVRVGVTVSVIIGVKLHVHGQQCCGLPPGISTRSPIFSLFREFTFVF
jgi:hypothetical protein